MVDLGTIHPRIRVDIAVDPDVVSRGLRGAGAALTRVAAVATFVGTILAEAAVAGFRAIGNALSGIRDGTSDLAERLSPQGQNALRLLGNSLNDLGRVFQNAWISVLERILPGLAHFAEAVADFSEKSTAAQGSLSAFANFLKVTLTVGALLKGFLEAAARSIALVWNLATAVFRAEWEKAINEIRDWAISVQDIGARTARLIGDIWNENTVIMREVGGKLGKPADDAASGLGRLAAEGRRVFEATRTPVEALEERLRRLGVMLQHGVIDQDTFERAADRARAVVSQTHRVLRDVASAFEQAFVDAVTGVKRLSEALRSLLNDLAKIYLRATFRQILFSAFGNNPAFSGLFGGGLFRNAQGGLYRVAGAGGVVPARAMPSEWVSFGNPAHEAGALTVNVRAHDAVDIATRTAPNGALEIFITDREAA
jgi:hypothetical protein